MKQGSATANTLGTLTVMYSGFGVLLQYARGEDDEINTLVAATSTGLLYKSTAGLKRCALGGGVGLGVASLYCLYTYFAKQQPNQIQPVRLDGVQNSIDILHAARLIRIEHVHKSKQFIGFKN